MVLLHGFTHTGVSWAPVVEALPSGWCAACPDIRGHGTAADTTPVTLEAVISDVARAAPERFVLAGYSMGGRIALHVALALGERVQRLVLISMNPGIEDPGEREARRRADECLAEQVVSLGIEEFSRRWETTPVLSGQSATVLTSVRADRLRNTPEGIARALRGLGPGTMPSAWPRMAELRIPVTVIAGGRDSKFVSIAQRIARELRNAQLAIVPGAGHAVHLEASQRVAAIIAGDTS